MRQFQQVFRTRLKKSGFPLSHDKVLTMRMGRLTPTMMFDTIPGDHLSGSSELFVRFMPLQYPVMHRVNIHSHTYKIPFRILMKDYGTWIKGVDNNGNKSTETLPTFDPYDVLQGLPQEKIFELFGPSSLWDYLGYPAVVPGIVPHENINRFGQVSMLPLLAYAMVWNEFYRDSELHEEIDIKYWEWTIQNTQEKMIELLKIRNRCWEKDYFTTARPDTQKGDSIKIPGQSVITSSGIVKYDPLSGSDGQRWRDTTGTTNVGLYNSAPATFQGLDNASGSVNSAYMQGPWIGSKGGGNINLDMDPNGTLYVDSQTAVPQDLADINQLRQAFQLQHYLEALQRAGNRLWDWLMTIFGVDSKFARLQMPEYVGGHEQNVIFSEVLQTSETTLNSPQGEMSGHGISVGTGRGWKVFCEEHCIMLTITSLLPRTKYMLGLQRFLYKTDPLEFGLPQFAHLGKQALLQKELRLVPGREDLNESVFGYVDRYSEYKFIPSSIHGQMLESQTDWHLARMFPYKGINGDYRDAVPLNGDFVTTNPDVLSRIFAVTQSDTDNLVVNVLNHVKGVRPLPRHTIPGYADHP